MSWPSALEIFFGQEPAVLNNLIYQHSSVSQRSASAELADRRPSSPLFSESGRAATREPCAMARNRCAISLPTAVLCLGDLNMYLSIPIDVYSSPFSHESLLCSAGQCKIGSHQDYFSIIFGEQQQYAVLVWTVLMAVSTGLLITYRAAAV